MHRIIPNNSCDTETVRIDLLSTICVYFIGLHYFQSI